MPEAATAATEERVLEIVRELALELGSSRAVRAVSPVASLERDIGLGSLERVELLVRLEAAFGRALGERFLSLDTAAGIARAVEEASPFFRHTACAKRERSSNRMLKKTSN